MTALIILGGLLLLLCLLGLVRVGGGAEYSDRGFFVRVKIGIISIQVYPFPNKKKEKRPKKEKNKKKQSADATPTKKKGGSLARLRYYLPLVGEAAGMLKQRIRIDKLYLDLLIATRDAADTALAYGYANMILGILWPVLEENFEVCDHRIQTGVDFDTDSPTVYVEAAFSARIGQLFSLGCRLGWKFLKIYREEKRKNLQKEAI